MLSSTAVATKCKGMVEKELKQLITQVGVPLGLYL